MAVAMLPTATRRPTWAELTAAEPRLAGLLAEARAIRATSPRFCANAVWYGYRNPRAGLKDRMCRLVGWDRRSGPAILRTNRAYDTAYKRIYEALPDCRDCGCMRLG